MKLFFAIIIAISAVPPAKEGAVLSFIGKSIHVFPDTKEGEKLEHIYKIKNTGTKPLIIYNYNVRCSCTKAFFSKEPIMPGETSQIKVTFDTSEKYGYQDRLIFLNTNSKKKSIKIRFKVYVYNLTED